MCASEMANPPTRGIEDTLEASELGEWLHDALRTVELSGFDWVLLWLHLVKGWSLREIATAAGLAHTVIQDDWHRIIAALQDELPERRAEREAAAAAEAERLRRWKELEAKLDAERPFMW